LFGLHKKETEKMPIDDRLESDKRKLISLLMKANVYGNLDVSILTRQFCIENHVSLGEGTLRVKAGLQALCGHGCVQYDPRGQYVSYNKAHLWEAL